MAYDAFISYSHAADGRLVKPLQAVMQGLARPWHRRRMVRVFRDETNLAASPALWPSLQQALEESRYLLLLASPESAQSKWVQREVGWWLEHRSPDSILIALTDGDIWWNEETGGFDRARTNALPPQLLDSSTVEPLWVDLRWAQDLPDLSPRHPDLVTAVAELSAPIRGVPKDELVGEDLRQHRRTRALATAAIALLALLLAASVAAALVAVDRSRVANRERLNAEQAAATAEAERDLAQANERRARAGNLAFSLQTGRISDPELARLLAVEAIRLHPTSAEARSALLQLSYGDQFSAMLRGDGVRFVESIAFSPDGTMLASSADNGPMLVWDLATRTSRPLAAGPGESFVRSVAFSPVGSLLAFGDNDGQIVLIDPAAGSVPSDQLDSGHGKVWALMFGQDGKTLASAHDDGVVVLWDLAARPPTPRTLLNHPGGSATDVALSADGRLVASAGTDGLLAIRDIATGEAVTEPLVAHGPQGAAGTSLTFSPDSRLLAAADDVGAILVWDTEDWKLHFDPPIQLPSPDWISDLAFNPDGSLLASAGFTGVSIWNPQTGDRIAGPLGYTLSLTGFDYVAWTSAVAFDPDGATIASAQYDGTILLWDVAAATDAGVAWSRPAPAQVGAVAFAPDSGLLAVGDDAGSLVLWEDEGWTTPLALREPDGAMVAAAAFSADDRWLATAGTAGLSVWRIGDQHPTAQVSDVGTLTDLALSPRGGLLASAGIDGVVRLWELPSLAPAGELIYSAGPSSAWSVAFSSDGSLIASAHQDGAVALWDVAARAEAGEPLRVSGAAPVNDIAFSPNGDMLAAASNEDGLRLWDVSARVPIGDPLLGAESPLLRNNQSVAFSPDGEFLAVGSADGVEVWELATGWPLTRLYRTPNPTSIADIAFSDDGRWLVGGGTSSSTGPPGSPSGLTAVWEFSADGAGSGATPWTSRACAVAGRNLTPEEWSRYIGNEPWRPTCPEVAATPTPG